MGTIRDHETVSVIVPCRNEEKFIGKCLDCIIANDYPVERLEVLVVDGRSDDGTRGIVEKYAELAPFIRLLDNPGKIIPLAMNLGIKNAKGDVIMILGAHSECPAHFISRTVEYLNRTEADVVGGPIITKPFEDTFEARVITFVTSHPFGVGNSKFRTSAMEGYVDTVPYGAYRRDVFDKVGLFDERLIRNQDNELNSRIIKKGGKIYQTPRLAVYYYNQSTFRGLLKQAFRTGMWNVATVKINPAAYRLRHFVPLFFVTSLLALGALAPFLTGARYEFLALIGLYGSAAGISSFQIGLKEGMKYIWILPVIFFLYHVFYGFGSFVGLLKIAIIDWKVEPNRNRLSNSNDENPAKEGRDL